MAYQIHCPGCRAANPAEVRFCQNCGSPFVTAIAWPPPYTSPPYTPPPYTAPPRSPPPYTSPPYTPPPYTAPPRSPPPYTSPPYTPPPYTAPPRSPPPDAPRTRFNSRKKWRSWGLIGRGIAVIAAIFLIFFLFGAINAVIGPSDPTAEAPTASAPTAVPTAAAKPTAAPHLFSFRGLLVEHPASASGDDKSADINKEEDLFHTLDTPFHRATIDGRDVYKGVTIADGQKLTYYMFPLGSFDEARVAQAAYVKQFENHGFIKISDHTSMSKHRSFILLQDSSGGTLYVDALGFQAYLGGPAMDIYSALSSTNTS
jgi:hypothetical protein